MKWYEWMITGIVSFLIILILLPFFIFLEWRELMKRIESQARRWSPGKG